MTAMRSLLFLAATLSLFVVAAPQVLWSQVAPQALQMPIPANMARRQVSVVVRAGLTNTKKLPTDALRKARKAMLAGTEISDANLKALADRWDGHAAQKYERILVAQSSSTNASDIAYYGTIAVSTGRVWSLPDVIQALGYLDPKTEPADRIKVYGAMLTAHAWAGNSLALDAVIDFNGTGKLLGPMSEATRKKVLAQGAKDGDGRAALHLALALMQQPDRSDADNALVKQYLGLAAKGNNLMISTTATNLLALPVDGSAKTVPSQ